MNEEIYKFLSESFLFKDMTTDEIKSLTKAVDFRIEKYISKDVIVSPKITRIYPQRRMYHRKNKKQ